MPAGEPQRYEVAFGVIFTVTATSDYDAIKEAIKELNREEDLAGLLDDLTPVSVELIEDMSQDS